MKTITVPDNLIREKELVIIPRRDYERLLAGSAEKVEKRDSKIDREIAISMAEFKAGKIVGPFNTAKELMDSLKPGYRQPKVKVK